LLDEPTDDRARAAQSALDGLRVLDLTRVLAGPLCTQLLADHGAEVLKIESPSGDDTRRLGRPEADGSAPYFHALNRNKRSAVLDLASAAGRNRLLELAAGADVLVENFLPGTMRRWGLDYERDLAPANPRLVYCAISGFGDDGPLGGLPGYDAVAQAACGLMSVNGDESTGPLRVGVPVVDISTGLHATIGILLALAERSRSGKGQRVESTLFDSALSLLLPHAADWLMQGREHGLSGNRHPGIVPYEKFRVRDGEVFIGVLGDRQFQRLCERLGCPALAADPRFASNMGRVTNREALTAALAAPLRALDAEALCRDLMADKIPASRVRSVAQVLGHPHAAARGAVASLGAWRGVASPVRLARTPASLRRLPPVLDPEAEAAWT
jgi:crotonobetainyl-CoA:carnitine CoA-transferase CaiB-like acyl-CoA transferase